MAVPILVLTSSKSFGTLIQHTLDSTGRYKVVLVNSAAEGLERAALTSISLCILDSGGQIAAGRGFLKQLRVLLPETRLVVVLSKEDLANVSPTDLLANSYLLRPFHLPDLLDTVEEALQHCREMPEPLPESRLQAGTGPVQPGQPDPIPGLSWLRDVNRSAQYLARLSLETSAQAALIVRQDRLWAYAGQLPQQAVEELVQVVLRYRARNGGGDLARFVRLDALGSDHMLYATDLGEQMILALVFDGETPFSKIRSQAAKLARALASPPVAEEPPDLETAADPAADFSLEESREGKPVVTTQIPPLFDEVPPPDMPQLSHMDGLEGQEVVRDILALPPVEQTGSLDFLETVTPALCNLSLACLIIPRLPQHRLVGDLAARLGEWLPQICLAFDWRAEHVSIQPDYLLWVVRVTPAASPGHLMQTIREQTSRSIFAEFPSLCKENPGGDFWAPGYLIISSPQPPALPVIQSFIQQTRRHQGVLKPILQH